MENKSTYIIIFIVISLTLVSSAIIYFYFGEDLFNFRDGNNGGLIVEEPRCGDNICNGQETCSDCAQDCCDDGYDDSVDNGDAVDDTVYIAFKIEDIQELDKIIETVGKGNLNGNHKLAVSSHFNPLGNVFTEKEYPFPVNKERVRARLEEMKTYDLPITVDIFAGKFFESRVTQYLEDNENNLMIDQFNKPILLDRIGGTYFSLFPSRDGFPKNEYLEIYEKNTKDLSAVVAYFIRENPGRVVSLSFAGEVKYPPATEGAGKNLIFRWADYSPLAIINFREFLENKYNKDFDKFLSEAGISQEFFDSFDEVDPPRGQNRGDWDSLGDANNRYFLIWQEFRIQEVKNHIKQTVQWGKDAGIVEDGFTKFYSQQAIWEKDNIKNYYWRASPIETLEVEGINPVVSLYGDKTADENFIKQVGEIARNYPGRWGSLQYNPDGPCDENGKCDVAGYSADEYYKRLKLAEENGVRMIAVYGDDSSEEFADADRAKHFIRGNFYVAAKRFLAE